MAPERDLKWRTAQAGGVWHDGNEGTVLIAENPR
jgi:hypothetical protein